MAAKAPAKDERIDIRVSAEFKALFARAAELSGSSVSAFVIEAARARAYRLLAEHDRIVLNNKARDAFLKTVASPPAPNAALRRAARKYAVK